MALRKKKRCPGAERHAQNGPHKDQVIPSVMHGMAGAVEPREAAMQAGQAVGRIRPVQPVEGGAVAGEACGDVAFLAPEDVDREGLGRSKGRRARGGA